MSLQDFIHRIKSKPTIETLELDESGEVRRFSLFRKFFLSIIIVLTILLSYGIGRLSNTDERGVIKIEYDPLIPNEQFLNTQKNQTASVIQNFSEQEVIVSKNGARYHYQHCSSAKRIKEENKITFATAKAAEAAGYTLAANCLPR